MSWKHLRLRDTVPSSSACQTEARKICFSGTSILRYGIFFVPACRGMTPRSRICKRPVPIQ